MAEEGLLEKFFTPFYERVKNPFMGSFIISWLIVNWRIGYATFFLENKDIKLINPTLDTKIEYIQSLFNPYDLLVWPIVGAVSYVTIIQGLALLFSWAMEWFSQKQLSNKLNLIKGSPRVSGEMYVELLNKLKLEENKLPEHKDKIAAADNKRIEAENKLAELNQAITKYNQDSIGKDQQIEYYKKLYDNELIIKNNSKSTFYKSQILTKSLELISGFDLKNNTNHFLQLVNSSIGLIINTEVRSFDVKSDSGTLFLGAHEYPNILSGRAIVKENIPPWSALKNKYLNVFHDCHWISHAENLTIAEEQAGGTYIFVKNVVIYELNRINRINIYSFADDFLEISINNVSPIYPEQGFDLHNNPIIRTFTLVKSQLPDYFVEGVNFIVFKVRNVSIPNAKTINSNPYGIIYKITFEMGEQGADFI